jgi:hypothetical protein
VPKLQKSSFDRLRREFQPLASEWNLLPNYFLKVHHSPGAEVNIVNVVSLMHPVGLLRGATLFGEGVIYEHSFHFWDRLSVLYQHRGTECLFVPDALFSPRADARRGRDGDDNGHQSPSADPHAAPHPNGYPQAHADAHSHAAAFAAGLPSAAFY